jgi:FlaA1/EpsC-like NDP-sugar epimerase
MSNSVDDERIRFLIGDVRDRKRVFRAMNNVDIVVHAAALKHVPVCEYNPIEAVKTNISGAVNIIDAAIDNKVRHVMANSYAGPGKTKFSCVRYGNVVGSRGSVIPLFKKQMVNGEITITDKRMTRFWITLEQGIRFVMKSIELMKGGEIFIPKIPSMRVTDLAEVIAPGVRQKEVGIRPGEKLHEVLLTEDESRHSLEYDNYYIIEPEHAFWGTASHPDGKIPPEGFRYTSDTNSRWLSKDELRVITDIP